MSQVERNLTTPSIATLEDILEVLGSNLSEFFHEEPERKVVFSTQDFFEDVQDDYTIEWVIPNAQKNQMEPILLTIHPHKKSHVLSSYQGEEFGYVLKGAVTIVRGNEKYKVKRKRLFISMEKRVIIYTIMEIQRRKCCGLQRRRCSDDGEEL